MSARIFNVLPPSTSDSAQTKDRRWLPGQRTDCEDGIEIEAPLYLYLLFAAPDEDFAGLQATLNRLVNSLQLR